MFYCSTHHLEATGDQSMVTIFKKVREILTRLKSIFEIKNPDLNSAVYTDLEENLISDLTEVGRYKNLEELLKDPVSKIYILNVYSNNFNDLGGMVVDKRYPRKLIAINLHSFCNGEESRISIGLVNIVKFLKKNKPTPESVHDLRELISVIRNLIELRG